MIAQPPDPALPATRAPNLNTPDALIAASPLPRTEARRLLEYASQQRREWLLAHGDEPLDHRISERFLTLQRRRIEGEPIAYLCHEREFRGLSLRVGPAVLIPRPETERLVEEAEKLAPTHATVLDLGTGSGAIAIALCVARSDLHIIASDRSQEALAVARDNARHHGLGPDRIEFREGSWWDPIDPSQRFDLIVSNPPYIAEVDPHLHEGDLRFEPRQALASGRDGLDALHTIAAGAPSRLRVGGWLLVEHGWDQGPAVRALFGAAGLDAVHTHRDLAGHERVTVGRHA